MRLAVFVAVVGIFLSSCATVKLTGDESAALKALQRYLELDRSGARIDSARVAQIAPLAAWTDEPGWDAIIISSGWSIGRPEMKDGKVVARVRYEVAGLLDGKTFVSPDTPESSQTFEQNTEVVYTLANHEGAWKVESPQLPPHVGFPAIKKHIAALGDQQLVQDVDDAEYVAKLKGARAGHCNCGRLDF